MKIQKQANPSLLAIEELRTSFFTDRGEVRACDGVSYRVEKGETLAVVGESGSGKSVSAMSVLGLIPDPPGRVVDGKILFKGQDLLQCSQEQMRTIRGNSIAMIFQEPMTSLNPVMTVAQQIGESLMLHKGMTRHGARARVLQLLEMVGIADGARRADNYPHQLSGGMRQRVMIAMALACEPELLIADEPTSALDVTIQAQILGLIDDLQQKIGMGVILITHDMGVVAECADRVAVMYCGRIMEFGSRDQIFDDPRHPYLFGLSRAVPDIYEKRETLLEIRGSVPDPLEKIAGCVFAPRCPKRFDRCEIQPPPRCDFGDGHYACCGLYDGGGQK